MRVRQSFLKKYMECPARAKFDMELRPRGLVSAKMSFGTCIHFVLEDYNRYGDLKRALVLWRDLWNNPEKLEATPDYYHPRTSHRNYMIRGEKIIREVHERASWDTRRVLAVEHQFLVPFGDHELTGTVDLIELRRRGNDWVLQIVDYKTSSKRPTAVQLRQDIQFTTYHFASTQPEFWLGNGPEFPGMDKGEEYWEILQNYRRYLVWYGLWFNAQFDAGERTDRDYMRLYRLIEMFEKAMEHDLWVPNISGETCEDCPYQDPCGLPFQHQVDALEGAA